MDRLLIRGGRQLGGDVKVSGAKNAALPILATALMVPGQVRFENLPHLNDVPRCYNFSGGWESRFCLMIRVQLNSTHHN